MNHINELASKGVFWAVQKFLTDNKLTVKEFLSPTKTETVGLILPLLGYQDSLADLTAEDKDNLKKELKSIVQEAEVYDTPEGVKSHIVAKIEWDTSNVYREFESWKKYTCGNCGHSKITDPEDDDTQCCEAEMMVESATHSDDIPQYLFDQEWKSFEEGLKEYCQTVYNIPAATHLLVEAGNINWRGSSGHKVVKIDSSKLIGTISIGNDNTIKLTQRDDGTLTGYCAHHDATTHLKVHPAVLCCETGEAIRMEDWAQHKENAEIVNILLDEEGRYEFLTAEGMRQAIDDLAYYYENRDCPANRFKETVKLLMSRGHMDKHVANTLLEEMTNE